MNLTKAVQVFQCTMGHPNHSAKALETVKQAYDVCLQNEALERLDADKVAMFKTKYAELLASPVVIAPEPLLVQATRKWLHLYENAVRRNKDFNLEISDVQNLLSKYFCEYTGTLFSEDQRKTVDRLDDSKGYVKGNVFMVTDQANRVKNILLEHEDSPYHMPFSALLNLVDTLYSEGYTNER